MRSNVCYQKTDFGSETPDLVNKCVPKKTKIAGIRLDGDISKEDLRVALDVPTLISELENDMEYMTSEEVSKIRQAIEEKYNELSKKTENSVIRITRLESDLSSEISKRDKDSENIWDTIRSVYSYMGDVDDSFRAKIDDEAEKRQKADEEISELMASENERVNKKISALEDISHTHENMSALSLIDYGRIQLWNSVTEMATREEISGILREIQIIYGILGVAIYDGGGFCEILGGICLDGGELSEEPEDTVNFGGFEAIALVSDIDGGVF